MPGTGELYARRCKRNVTEHVDQSISCFQTQYLHANGGVDGGYHTRFTNAKYTSSSDSSDNESTDSNCDYKKQTPTGDILTHEKLTVLNNVRRALQAFPHPDTRNSKRSQEKRLPHRPPFSSGRSSTIFPSNTARSVGGSKDTISRGQRGAFIIGGDIRNKKSDMQTKLKAVQVAKSLRGSSPVLRTMPLLV